MKSRDSNGNSPFVNEWISASNSEGKIAHVELCNDFKGGLDYLLKYVCKPVKRISPEQKAELFTVLYRQRLLFTFGSMYSIGAYPQRVCLDCGCPFQYISDYEFDIYFTSSPYPKKPPDLNQKILNFI